MKTKHYDILISGGGTPGLTLALLLASTGLTMAVIDPAPAKKSQKDPQTRTSALMAGSIAILEKTGVWNKCAARGGIMRSLHIIDDSAQDRAPIDIKFSASEIDQDIFGVNMTNHILQDALAAATHENKNIAFLQGRKLVSFSSDDFGIIATLDDGENLKAKLIVGADGRHSTVRSGAGIEAKERDYGQQAITCLIEHSKPHNETSTEFHRPSGPFTLVPLPRNASSIVWVDFNDQIEQFMRLDRAAFERAVQERTRDILGTITLAAGPQSWPLKSLKAKTLIAPRTALVAEAAHVIHPLGAQGLNLSLRDVDTLAACLIEAAQLGLDPGSLAILKKYESLRRSDINLRVMGTDLLNRMVSNNIPALRGLRRIGIKTLDHASLLKEIAMRGGMAA